MSATAHARPAGRTARLTDRLWAISRTGRSPFFLAGTRRHKARATDWGLPAAVDLLEPRALLSATAATAAGRGEHVVAADFLPDVADLLVSDDYAADFAGFDGSGYEDHVFADAGNSKRQDI